MHVFFFLWFKFSIGLGELKVRKHYHKAEVTKLVWFFFSLNWLVVFALPSMCSAVLPQNYVSSHIMKTILQTPCFSPSSVSSFRNIDIVVSLLMNLSWLLTVYQIKVKLLRMTFKTQDPPRSSNRLTSQCLALCPSGPQQWGQGSRCHRWNSFVGSGGPSRG